MFGDTSSENSTGADTPSDIAPPARSGPSVTHVLIGLNVLVYLAMVVSGVSPISPTPKEVIPWGAGFGPLTLNGQWWRLLSECFIHFGLIHLAVNMYIFFGAGTFTERLFGKVRFLLLYLLAGLGGSIVSLYIHPLSASAGASGAIFGVYGGLLAFLLFRRGVLHASAVSAIARSALLFLGYNFIYGLADQKTDFSAHLGGLFTGFLVGALLVPSRSAVAARSNATRTIAVALGSLVLAAGALVLISRSRHPQDKFLAQVMLAPSIPLGVKGRVLYTGSATRDDANALATGWSKLGLDPNALLILSRDAGGPSLAFELGKDESDYKPLRLKTSNLVHGKDVITYSEGPAPPLPWNDPKVLASFRATGVSVAPLLGGPPFRVILLNNQGEPRKTLNIVERAATIGSADRIWYSGAVTGQNVQDTGRTLQSIGYFHDKGALVMLSRAPASTEISFVCAEGSWDNPKTVAAFQSLGPRLARAVGGPPLAIHLLDATFQPRKTLAVP